MYLDFHQNNKKKMKSKNITVYQPSNKSSFWSLNSLRKSVKNSLLGPPRLMLRSSWSSVMNVTSRGHNSESFSFIWAIPILNRCARFTFIMTGFPVWFLRKSTIVCSNFPRFTVGHKNGVRRMFLTKIGTLKAKSTLIQSKTQVHNWFVTVEPYPSVLLIHILIILDWKY